VNSSITHKKSQKMLEVHSGLDHFIENFDDLPAKVQHAVQIFEPAEDRKKNMKLKFNVETQKSCFNILAVGKKEDKEYFETLEFTLEESKFKKATKDPEITALCTKLVNNVQNHKFLKEEQLRTLEEQKIDGSCDEAHLKAAIEVTSNEFVVAYIILSLCSKAESDAVRDALKKVVTGNDVKIFKKTASDYAKKYPWSYLARYFELNAEKIAKL